MSQRISSRRQRKLDAAHVQAIENLADAIFEVAWPGPNQIVISGEISPEVLASQMASFRGELVLPTAGLTTPIGPDLQNRIDELQAQLAAETARADAGWSQAAGQESRVSECNDHLKEATVIITEISSREVALQQKCEALESEVEGYRQKLDRATAAAEAAASEIGAGADVAADLRRQLSRLQQEKAELGSVVDKLTADLSQARADLQKAKASPPPPKPAPARPATAPAGVVTVTDLPEAVQLIAMLKAKGFDDDGIQSRVNARRDPANRLNTAAIGIILEMLEAFQCL